MTDQTLADEVREIAEKMHHHASQEHVRRDAEKYFEIFAKQLEALLPPPPRPTLADMTVEERRACAWMQCDVEGQDGDWLIVDPFDDEDHAHVIGRRGNSRIFQATNVAPRPDLPRLEWPDNKKPNPAPALPEGWRLADHPDYGRVIVTNTTPDPSGHVYFVGPADDSMGCDRFFCDPARLMYLDTEPEADQ